MPGGRWPGHGRGGHGRRPRGARARRGSGRWSRGGRRAPAPWTSAASSSAVRCPWASNRAPRSSRRGRGDPPPLAPDQVEDLVDGRRLAPGRCPAGPCSWSRPQRRPEGNCVPSLLRAAPRRLGRVGGSGRPAVGARGVTVAGDGHRPPAGHRALSPAEWWRVGGMGATVVALNLVGWGIFILAVLPAHHRAKGVAIGAGVAVTAYTLGHAPRLRRRPHLGHRQHHPEVHDRGEAAAQRRLLVLPRALDASCSPSGSGLTFAAKAVFHSVGDADSPLQSFGGIFGTAGLRDLPVPDRGA